MPPPEKAASPKPSASEPADDNAFARKEAKRAPVREIATLEPQTVTVLSSPAGATATLDGHPSMACKTPCPLEAAPGRHTIAITMPGYQIDHQEIDIGTGPREVQVVLNPLTGTLMLVSDPPGASISLNGKKVSQTTPATIPVPLGSYQITLEKDGKQGTGSVNVGTGFNYLKIPLR
jgi:hypothetical protein